jgi:regulator of replication initiation timing
MNTLRFKTETKILLATIILLTTVSGLNQALAYDVTDIAMCYNYSYSSLKPKGNATAFFTHQEYVAVWVNVTNPPDEVQFNWNDPSDKRYKSTTAELVQLEGKDWGIFFSQIDVEGKTSGLPGNKPGKWSVSAYIDHEEQKAIQFQIIDYEQLSADIFDIINQVNDLRDSLQDYQDENTRIREDYETLQTDFEELQAQGGDDSALKEIEADYDALKIDYIQLETSMGTTRLMMYGAVVIAVISIGVAVYFGAMKK